MLWFQLCMGNAHRIPPCFRHRTGGRNGGTAQCAEHETRGAAAAGPSERAKALLQREALGALSVRWQRPKISGCKPRHVQACACMGKSRRMHGKAAAHLWPAAPPPPAAAPRAPPCAAACSRWTLFAQRARNRPAQSLLLAQRTATLDGNLGLVLLSSMLSLCFQQVSERVPKGE